MRIIALAGLALVTAASMPESAPPPSYVIVVHASNSFDVATTDQVSRLFLRKEVQWRDGTVVQPVDQAPRSTVRQAFSIDVHGRPVQAVQAYWRQKLFAGEAVPPMELGTDGDVLDFVRTHPDAIGYVAVGTALGVGVRAVVVTR